MTLEDAITIIDESNGDMKLILSKITDNSVLKQLMRLETFSDQVIEYFSNNPKAPGRNILLEILKDISAECIPDFGQADKSVLKIAKSVNIHIKAREEYLLSYRRDFMARYFIDKLRLTPLKSAALGLLLVLSTYSLGLILHIILHRPIAGITISAIDFIYDLVMIPVVFGYYVWISVKSSYLFLELQSNGTIINGEKNIEHFVSTSVNGLINRKLWSAISGATAIASVLITVCVAATYSTIWGPRESSFILFFLIKVPLLWGLSWYMVIMIFLKETAIIISIRRLFTKKEFRLNALNEDLHGGLKPVVDFATRFSYFIMACGFGFVLLFLRSWKYSYTHEDIFVIIALFLYIILACFFFFSPLRPAQRLSLKLKREYFSEARKVENIVLIPPLRPITVFRFALTSSLPVLLLLLYPIIRSGLKNF